MSRALLAVLLGVVAAAAAVLPFSALNELGRPCGFAGLAPLLPVVLDAGAAAGTLVWPTRPDGPARRFGRGLAVALLGASAAGNAVGHLLVALAVTTPWWLVVAVSAVAPTVLGAVVHLAVLAAQARSAGAEIVVKYPNEVPGDEETLDEHGLSPLWAGRVGAPDMAQVTLTHGKV